MFAYQAFLVLFRIGVWLSLPFSDKNRKLINGRKGLFDEIRRYTDSQSKNKPVFWFHCASLGEFEQGRPVIEQLKQIYPSSCIVLTFFSPSGYEVRKNYEVADLVCYLPLDGKRNAQKFISLIKPDIAFFVKYEFWYGYLTELKKRGVPSISISAIFRPNAVPFRWYGGFYKKILKQIGHYFVQDENSLALLKVIGIENVTLAGDTRFDRVAAICRHVEQVELARTFKQQDKVMVIGSSWPADLDVLLPLMQEFADEIKFIVAPHNIEEKELERIEEAIPYKTVLFSKAKVNMVSNYRILLIDNVGILTSLYQYGEFAYVGGAFGKSLHNILEPATFGMPIFFGNNSYQHFNEANALLKLGAAYTVADAEELRHKFLIFLRDEEKRKEAGEICRKYVSENTGATEVIANYVKTNLVK